MVDTGLLGDIYFGGQRMAFCNAMMSLYHSRTACNRSSTYRSVHLIDVFSEFLLNPFFITRHFHYFL